MCRVLVPAAAARSGIEMPSSRRAASSRWDRSVMTSPTIGTDTSFVQSPGQICLTVGVVPPQHTRYRIGILRARADVSRLELAKATGRSAKQIERYENGRAEPPADVLVKMAARLDVTVDELLGLAPRVPGALEINGARYERSAELAAAAALTESEAAADEADSLRPGEPPAGRGGNG